MEDAVEDETSEAETDPFDPAPRGSGPANRQNLANTRREGTGLGQVTTPEAPEEAEPASSPDSEERELQEQLARLRRDREKKKEDAARKKREEEEAARQHEADLAEARLLLPRLVKSALDNGYTIVHKGLRLCLPFRLQEMFQSSAYYTSP